MYDIVNEALLDKMVKQKKITASAKAIVVDEAHSTGKSMSEILVSRQFISDRDLVLFLSGEFGFVPIHLGDFKIDNDVLRVIPAQLARKLGVLPVSKHDDVLTIAMRNPTDVMLLDDLRARTNLRVKAVIAPFTDLQKAIDYYYPKDKKDEGPQVPAKEETIEELIRIVQDSKEEGDQADLDLMRQAQETPVIKVANLMLLDAIKRKASDLFIEPWENHIRIRFRVDGILEEGKAPPKAMGLALVSRFKVMSQLNIAERRIPQDGRFKIKVQDREVDVRVSILPSSFGEKVCLRILDKKAQSQSIERLGFTDRELDDLKRSATKPHGMLLVTGPTGSGKTTTLYSILKYIDSPEKNITTVEDPVEYQVDGINQVNVKENIGLTFPSALRSILRQDPDIILIGEIRDTDTMDIAIKAALTGHLVLTTLHTNDACSSIVRIVNMGIEPFLISSSILMISAQRLIRRICMACRSPYHPEDSILEKLKLDPKKKYTFYHPQGCPKCRGTGYFGRTVITEILTLRPEIKELIIKRVTGDELKQAARKFGMRTLRECAVGKVVEGETAVDEIYRVTTGDQDLESDLVSA